MDYIGPMVSPYREVIKYIACFFTISHCIFGFKKIHDFRAMGQCRVEPVLGAIVIAIIQYQRDLAAGDHVQANWNLFALLFYSTALFVFYVSGDAAFKCCVQRKVWYTAVVFLLCLAFTLFADERLVAMCIRGITTLTLTIVLGAPILKLPNIIATKNHDGLSLKAMACGCGVSLLWIMQGIAWNDYALLNRNVAILVLELIPLLICICFRGNDRQTTQTVNNNINLNDDNDSVHSNTVSPLPLRSPAHSSRSRSGASINSSARNSTVGLSNSIRSSLSLISAISTTGDSF